MAKGKSKAPIAAQETLTNDAEFDQHPPATDTEIVSKPKKAEEIKVSPNDELDLSGFDYKSLIGESFKEYVSMVGDRSYKEVNEEGKEIPVNGELLQNDKYDFVLLPAVPVMKARFPGMENTPWDFVGIKAKDTAPIHRTRIPVKTALEYNAQIINQHSRAGHGKYYFLAKD
jgi:hypothetical protein